MNPNHPQTLTVLESHQLLDKLLTRGGTTRQLVKAVRNHTMALLMLDAGLRVGEVSSLLVSDLWFNDRPVDSLSVRQDITKTKTERTIPLSSRTRASIAELARFDWHRPSYPPTFPAFYTRDNAIPITTRQIQRIIGNASLAAFGRKIHPHVLRHTFATRLMRVCNIRIVQELLGHKSLASTQVYTHPGADDLKNAIDTVAANGL